MGGFSRLKLLVYHPSFLCVEDSRNMQKICHFFSLPSLSLWLLGIGPEHRFTVSVLEVKNMD